MREASLEGANLSHADLSGADLTGEHSHHHKGDWATQTTNRAILCLSCGLGLVRLSIGWGRAERADGQHERLNGKMSN